MENLIRNNIYKYFFVFIASLCSIPGFSQTSSDYDSVIDSLHGYGKKDMVVDSLRQDSLRQDSLRQDSLRQDSLKHTEQIDYTAYLLKQRSSMPSIFKGVNDNIIEGHSTNLERLFLRLQSLKGDSAFQEEPVRIVHIGDSHVRSHRFTPALNARFVEEFGSAAKNTIGGYHSPGIVEEIEDQGVVSHCIGINGATSISFTDEKIIKQIVELNPDLIIISLGTNESMGRYNSYGHFSDIKRLHDLLTTGCPEAVILYTTPPGNHLRQRVRIRKGRRRRFRYVVGHENPGVEQVVSSIIKFAQNNNALYWDLYNLVGGRLHACKNWSAGNYYQKDKIHFVDSGYILQGNLLYEAFSVIYNQYIKDEYK